VASVVRRARAIPAICVSRRSTGRPFFCRAAASDASSVAAALSKSNTRFSKSSCSKRANAQLRFENEYRPWIASAAMNTCSGGKRDRLCLRWSRCGTASDSRAVQSFHFGSGGASPVPCPKSSGDHTREVNAAHRSAGLLQQSSQPCIVFAA
jgi:hypothetical protein